MSNTSNGIVTLIIAGVTNDAWPAVTVDALCHLGYWDVAIPFLRRTRAAVYEGVYAQEREFFGATRRDRDAPSALRCVRAACANARAGEPLQRRSSAHCSAIDGNSAVHPSC
jgi:hypothetical protein